MISTWSDAIGDCSAASPALTEQANQLASGCEHFLREPSSGLACLGLVARGYSYAMPTSRYTAAALSASRTLYPDIGVKEVEHHELALMSAVEVALVVLADRLDANEAVAVLLCEVREALSLPNASLRWWPCGSTIGGSDLAVWYFSRRRRSRAASSANARRHATGPAPRPSSPRRGCGTRRPCCRGRAPCRGPRPPSRRACRSDSCPSSSDRTCRSRVGKLRLLLAVDLVGHLDPRRRDHDVDRLRLLRLLLDLVVAARRSSLRP